MVVDDLPSDASLADVLGRRALRTPADRLGIDIAGGALIAGVTLWARPPGWVVIAAAGLCLLAYGVWAVAERHLQPARWPDRVARESLWRATRAVAAVVGLAAFGLFLFAGLGVGLGPMIS